MQKGTKYLLLLALQVAIQPILTKAFIPKSAIKSGIVLVQELIKFVISLIMLKVTNNLDKISSFSLKKALIPASLYCIQNIAVLQAYSTLDPISFNVINQTKTISAAICCFLIIGRKQSRLQIVALIMLMLAACIIENEDATQIIFRFLFKNDISNKEESGYDSSSAIDFDMNVYQDRFIKGVCPLLFASFLSGFTGSLTEKLLQSGSGRNSYLFSIELCVASAITILISMLYSTDGVSLREHGIISIFGSPDERSLAVLSPIVLNAFGGIVVGLVTKYNGAVRKGFGVMLGIVLSLIIQWLKGIWQYDEEGNRISLEQCLGCLFVIISLYLHSANPVVKDKLD